MTAWVDLHLHSCCSDGTERPEALIMRAAATGAVAAALTDHDAVDGTAEAREAAATAGIGFLAGVEISAEFQSREMHIVGLGVDTASEDLCAFLMTAAQWRRDRFEKIQKRLRALGLFDGATAMTGAAVDAPGRMHLAVALRNMGRTATVQQAFDRYLNKGKSAYVPKKLPDAAAAVAVIHAAGGLAFIAHPGLGQWSEERVAAMLALPFDGIEAWHPSHSAAVADAVVCLAKRHNLLVSGGSDCHGNVKGEGHTLGQVQTPVACYHRIVEALS